MAAAWRCPVFAACASMLALAACDPVASQSTGAAPSKSVASSAPSPGAPSPSATATLVVPCPKYDGGRVVGRIGASALDETSGIAASRSNPGILWMHNDSGHASDIYAMDTSGALRGTFNVVGGGNVDWEDIAIGRGRDPNRDSIYIADAGANKGPRETFSVYRAVEPEVSRDGPPVVGRLDDVETIDFAYADGESHDAETIMIDPVRGDFLLVTKTWTGHCEVYRSALPEQDRSPELLERRTV